MQSTATEVDTGNSVSNKNEETICLSISDINECAIGTDNCAVGTATCTNIPGSFACACNSGYTGNGVMCTGEEIKECLP